MSLLSYIKRPCFKSISFFPPHNKAFTNLFVASKQTLAKSKKQAMGVFQEMYKYCSQEKSAIFYYPMSISVHICSHLFTDDCVSSRFGTARAQNFDS